MDQATETILPLTRTNMATLPEVLDYWYGSMDRLTLFGLVDRGEPSCFACGFYVPTDCANFLKDGVAEFDRSHLVDHALGGTPDVKNLVALCTVCNALMPSFDDAEKAIQWIRQRPPFHRDPGAVGHITETTSSMSSYRSGIALRLAHLIRNRGLGLTPDAFTALAVGIEDALLQPIKGLDS